MTFFKRILIRLWQQVPCETKNKLKIKIGEKSFQENIFGANGGYTDHFKNINKLFITFRWSSWIVYILKV